MCDREHYMRLENRMDRLEDDAIKHHTRVDEQIKTLFKTCEKLSDTATTVLKSTLAMVGFVVGFVVAVTVLALVYGAVGHNGFNAVTTAAREAK